MQKESKRPEKCTMYGKLLNRLKQGCKNVRKSARSLGASSQSNSSEANSECEYKEDRNATSPLHEHPTCGLDLLDSDSSLEDLKNLKDLSQSTSVDSFSTTLTTAKTTSGSSLQVDQFWIGFINSQTYKNWLKVGLALRSVCTFLTPLLEEIVHDLHASLLAKHGCDKLTQDHIEKYKSNTRESDLLRGWMRDVLKLHRHPPNPGEVFRISEVVKWPTCDGAWEVARVYMSKGYRTGGDGEDASAFDVSALLNFMYRCRLVDKYVHDFNNVKKVLQVRNTTMHNPSLQVSDEELEESFQAIFDLLKDTYLKRHAEKYFSTESFYYDVEELKSANFDLVTSAKHSLNILKDDMFDANNSTAHPSTSTVSFLRDVLSKILNLPNVRVSADFDKLQNHISEMESKVVQEYVDADKKIQQISAHVEHMNKKLDHLRNFIAKSKANKTNLLESAEDPAAPARKRKRKREPSPKVPKKNLREKPYPTANGVITDKTEAEEKTPENAENIKKAKVDEKVENAPAILPLNKHVHFDKEMVGSTTSTTTGSSDTTNDDSSSSYTASDTTSTSSSSFLPDSEHVELLPLYTSPSYQKTVAKQKRIIIDSSDDEDDYEGLGPPLPKRLRSDVSERDRYTGNKELATSELIVFPTGGSNVREIIGFNGRKPETYLVSKLQSFLKNQPNNEGATFTIRLNSDEKYYCSVSFHSRYAVSSPNLARSIKEAKEIAAAEAKRQMMENEKQSNRNLISKEDDSKNITAKTWFDNYAKKKAGKPPGYTCFRTNAELYISHVQVVSNFLLQPDDSVDYSLIFLQASSTTTISTIDLKSSVVKTALQQTALPISTYKPDEYFKVLCEYCLENGGTIPICQTTATQNPETGRVTRTCVLKSFQAEYFAGPTPLLSAEEKMPVDSEEQNKFNALYEDLLQAKAIQGHRSQHLAEESAAFAMLEKLGLTEQQLSELEGCCKDELKKLSKDFDVTIAYHSTKLPSVNGQPLYNCVVTSTCLKDTLDSFTATSDSGGCPSEDEACESAARNAILLLGMEIVLNLS